LDEEVQAGEEFGVLFTYVMKDRDDGGVMRYRGYLKDSLNDQVQAGQPGEQADDQEKTAEDLADGNEQGSSSIEEVEYSFADTDSCHHPSDDQDVGGAGDGRGEYPVH